MSVSTAISPWPNARTVEDGSNGYEYTIKLLPPLIIFDDDCDWILSAFDSVISDSHRGAVSTALRFTILMAS